MILSILRDSGSRPVMERADSVDIRNCLRTELANNGIREPFVFAVYNRRNDLLYTCGDYLIGSKDIYSIQLFNNTDYAYRLDVEFPDQKHLYILISEIHHPLARLYRDAVDDIHIHHSYDIQAEKAVRR